MVRVVVLVVVFLPHFELANLFKGWLRVSTFILVLCISWRYVVYFLQHFALYHFHVLYFFVCHVCCGFHVVCYCLQHNLFI